MKAILLILIIVIGGASYWKISEAEKKVKAAQATIEEAREMQNEAAKMEAKLRSAEAQIENLKQSIEDRDRQIAKLTDYDAKDAEARAREEERKAAAELANAKAASMNAEFQVRLAEMKKRYDLQRAALNQERTRMETALTASKNQKKYLEENPPEFNETGSVRVSKADRERVFQKHQADLAAVTAQVVLIQDQITEHDRRAAEYDASYEAAVQKAYATNAVEAR